MSKLYFIRNWKKCNLKVNRKEPSNFLNLRSFQNIQNQHRVHMFVQSIER